MHADLAECMMSKAGAPFHGQIFLHSAVRAGSGVLCRTSTPRGGRGGRPGYIGIISNDRRINL